MYDRLDQVNRMVFHNGFIFSLMMLGSSRNCSCVNAYDISQLYRCVLRLTDLGCLQYPKPDLPEHVARSAADLLARMLSTDPAARPTVSELQNHSMWWDSATLMTKSKELYDQRQTLPQNALAQVGMDGEDLQWQKRVNPMYLERIVNFEGAYDWLS